MDYKTDYSEKELKLFEALGLSYLTDRLYAVDLYKIAARNAFIENLIVLEFLSYDDANKSMDVKFQSATQDVVYKVQVKDKICISLRGESV